MDVASFVSFSHFMHDFNFLDLLFIGFKQFEIFEKLGPVFFFRSKLVNFQHYNYNSIPILVLFQFQMNTIWKRKLKQIFNRTMWKLLKLFKSERFNEELPKYNTSLKNLISVTLKIQHINFFIFANIKNTRQASLFIFLSNHFLTKIHFLYFRKSTYKNESR